MEGKMSPRVCSALCGLSAAYQCHGETVVVRNFNTGTNPSWKTTAGGWWSRSGVLEIPYCSRARHYPLFCLIMERSGGPQGLWEHMEALHCLNSKAKACPPELGQPLKDWPAVTTCFIRDIKGCHFILAFILHLYIIRLWWWEGVKRAVAIRRGFWWDGQWRGLLFPSHCRQLWRLWAWPLSFLVFGLAPYGRACGRPEEGQKPYRRPPYPRFALFNIWGPCLFVPQPLGGQKVSHVFFLFLHSCPPNSDLAVGELLHASRPWFLHP